jgi:hypothetical protein
MTKRKGFPAAAESNKPKTPLRFCRLVDEFVVP